MTGKTCKLSLQHVTVAKVNRLLRGLKSGKSSSFDGLDNFSIKLAADIIDSSIAPYYLIVYYAKNISN